MIEKKINILFVPSDLAGVGHFRSIWPAQQINKEFGDRFHVEVNNQPNLNDFNYLSKFQIIHFHRELGNFEHMPELFKKLKDMGIILIMDIDDYWMPPTTHPLYYMVVKNEISKNIMYLREKKENKILTIDKISFDNAVMLNAMTKNLINLKNL